MSFAQLAACIDGYNRNQGGDGDKPEPMSVARYEEILREKGYR